LERTLVDRLQRRFPRSAKCHKFFVEQSGSLPGVIIKVTANNGMYSLDHRLPAKATVPQILYYWRGGCTYVSMASRGNGGPADGFSAASRVRRHRLSRRSGRQPAQRAGAGSVRGSSSA
jgi:hypothetical protein